MTGRLVLYRMVHNEQTRAYRVERRTLLGWSFVTDPKTGDYLGFSDLESACYQVARKAARGTDTARRWKVVSDCDVQVGNRRANHFVRFCPRIF